MISYTLDFLRTFLVELGYSSPIVLFLLLLIAIMGNIIGRIEGWSKWDALYHAFINATTVGYGDFRPTTKPTKMLAIANAFVGLILTGIIVAIALHSVDNAIKQLY